MDWKYKHFHQERVFPSEPEIVVRSARRFMGESLGWKITDSAEGFSAEGYSFAHAAIAKFRVQTADGGTKIEIDLCVARAGATGFMLFDVGGYYNIQIRKWFDGIQWSLHQSLSGAQEPSGPPPPATNKTTACAFNGCLLFIVAMFGLWFLVNFICAIVGLVTGTLYLWGKGGTIVLHGVAARIVSALIVTFAGWLIWRIARKR